jgi:DNA-binding XRE family transcriptional regulator
MPVMTKTPDGNDIVILSRQEYDDLISAGNENARDARMAAAAIARDEETLTSEEVDELLAAKTPMAFWRKKRGLSQATLAKTVGVAQGFISEIESGRKIGDVRTLGAIARALSVTLDDLAPDA